MLFFVVCLAGPLLGGASSAAERYQLLPGLAGSDGRETVDAARYPWSAIGRVNRGTVSRGQGGFCTGTLVAPGVVLTAAHCLINGRTFRPLPPDTLHFVAGWDRGSFLWAARASSITLPPGLAAEPDLRRIPHRLDWALLQLDDAPTDAARIPIAAHTLGGAVAQAGYSQDRAHVLTADRSCDWSAVPAVGIALVSACSVTRGDSGSPLLQETDGGIAVAGILSAVRRHGQGWQGIAVPAEPIRAVLDQLLKNDSGARR